jgi:carboxymethylenebutenolidase
MPMCHSSESLPPVPPVPAHGVGFRGERVLRASDGASFTAFVARANQPSEAGMVIVPDGGGYSDFYKQLAVRFADIGIDAIAFDYYGRVPGAGQPPRPLTFRPLEFLSEVHPQHIDLDVARSAEYLRTETGARRIFSVGFCYGGAVAWRQAAKGLAGGIGLYGSSAALRETVPDLHALRSPVLLLVAGADRYYPLGDSLRLDHDLTVAGVSHRTVVYEAAPHGFFRFGAGWERESDDAWRRILEFTGVAEDSGTLQEDVVWWEPGSDRRPAALDELGFAGAMRWLVEDFGRRTPSMQARYGFSGTERPLDPALELTLFRVAQQALTSVERDVAARAVSLELSLGTDAIQIVVDIDGAAYDASRSGPDSHPGLRGVTERISQVSGRLEVRPRDGRGSSVLVEVPVR